MSQNKRESAKITKTIFSLFLFLLTFAFFFSTVSLQKAQAITISPAVIDEEYEPGNAYNGSFSVVFSEETADTLYARIFVIDHEDYSGSQETRLPDPEENTLAQWVSLDKEVIHKPDPIFVENEDNVVSINYTINVPLDAPPGGHYAAISVSEVAPENQSDESKLRLGYDVNYQILAKIPGEQNREYEFIDFRIKDDQFLFPHLPVELETVIKNNGNVHLIPQGNVEVFSGETKVFSTPLNKVGSRAFPQKHKLYTNVWSNEITEGEQNSNEPYFYQQQPKNLLEHIVFFLKSVVYELKYFRIGIYKAEVKGFVDNTPFSGEAQFLVLPYHLLITIVLIILIIILYFLYRKKRSKK